MRTAHPPTYPAPWKIVLAFAGIYLIWGSTYLAIRFAIETLPPFSMAAVRFIVAGGVLYAIARPRTDRPTGLNWLSAGIVGTLLLVGGNGAVVWAEQWVPSGLTALILATIGLWMVLFDWLFAGAPRPSKLLMAGLVWGLCGVGLLMSSTEVGAQSREGIAGRSRSSGRLCVLGGRLHLREEGATPSVSVPLDGNGDDRGWPGIVARGSDGRRGWATPPLRILDQVSLGSRLPDRVWCTDRVHGIHLAPRREHAGPACPHLRMSILRWPFSSAGFWPMSDSTRGPRLAVVIISVRGRNSLGEGRRPEASQCPESGHGLTT